MVQMKRNAEGTLKRDDFTGAYEDFKSLRMALSENRRYLKDQKSKTAKKIDEVFDSLQRLAEEAESCFKCLEARAHEFDVDEGTKANGYWSVLIYARKLIRRTTETVNIFAERRNSWFFNKENYLREILYISEMFLTLTSSLDLCKRIMALSDKGKLILNEKYTFKELLSTAGRFNQYCLFGKFNSAQLSEPISKVVKVVSGFLAAYSEVYYSDGRPLRTLWRCFKVITDEDQRALRSVAISQYASHRFFKSFMLLTERGLLCFAARSHNAITQPVSVNRLMLLQPKTLTLENTKGEPVKIPVPTSYIGRSPLPVRLLSKTQRSGMADRTSGRPPSPELVIHFHGGGFIGHTSRSHEVYLRGWARQLDCPVVSVDYSLSPEIPYPRPLEEAFFAYCYALKHPRQFGWTGEKIVLAGDSAGGVLVCDVLLKIIQYNLRLPNGAVLIYTPFQIAPVISPGRFLNFLDPLLSVGFLAICGKCYLNKVDLLSKYDFHERKMKQNTGQLKKMVIGNRTRALNYRVGDNERETFLGLENGQETEPRRQQPSRRGFWARLLRLKGDPDETDLKYEIKRDIFNPIPFCLDDFEDAPKDPFLSPLLTSDDVLRRLPPVSLLTADYDPFVDDNIEFAKRLKCLGVKTKLQVLEGLNHGFLNLCMLSGVARKGSDMCCQLISEHLRS